MAAKSLMWSFLSNFLLFLHLSWHLPSVQSIIPSLEFISVHMGSNPNSGYIAIRPAIEQALQQMNNKYPDLIANYTYRSKDSSNLELCGSTDIPASIADMASIFEEKDKEQPKVLIAARCLASYAVVGDFARELDFLSINCQSEVAGYHHHQRFPTTVSFAATGTGVMSSTFIRLMEKFDWKTIAVIYDRLSQSPTAGKVQNLCRTVMDELRATAGTINNLIVYTDSAFENSTQPLRAAREFSRIILSCTTVPVQRRLLVRLLCLAAILSGYVSVKVYLTATAKHLGMTNGDYVFINLSDDPLNWQNNDTLDEAVREALRSTLFIRGPLIQWNIIESTLREIQLNRNRLFGSIIGKEVDINNGVMIGCMEAVWAVWQVLNETCGEGKQSADKRCETGGRFLAKQLTNRTFKFPLRDITMNSQGIRVIYVHIYQWNAARNNLKMVFWADTESGILHEGPEPPLWLLGSAPRDRPLCGLQGQLCQKSPLAIYLPLLGAVLLIFSFLFFVYFKCLVVKWSLQDRYWMISESELNWNTHAETY